MRCRFITIANSLGQVLVAVNVCSRELSPIVRTSVVKYASPSGFARVGGAAPEPPLYRDPAARAAELPPLPEYRCSCFGAESVGVTLTSEGLPRSYAVNDLDIGQRLTLFTQSRTDSSDRYAGPLSAVIVTVAC